MKSRNPGRNNGVIGHPNACLSDAERFEIKVDRTGKCHRWTGAHNTKGYGNFRHQGRTRSAHIVALELAGVEIPQGMTVDHVWARGCQHRDCVRVDHLEIVPNRENIRRGGNPAAVNGRKAACIRGHEFTVANTITNSKGQRACRECVNTSRRKKYQARVSGAPS